VKQQHTSTASSILTTKSTYRGLSAQRLTERTVLSASEAKSLWLTTVQYDLVICIRAVNLMHPCSSAAFTVNTVLCECPSITLKWLQDNLAQNQLSILTCVLQDQINFKVLFASGAGTDRSCSRYIWWTFKVKHTALELVPAPAYRYS
jgi:hypothetical protein